MYFCIATNSQGYVVNEKTKHLLSDDLWFVIRFGFERTIVRPKVYTIRNTRNASFVNLDTSAQVLFDRGGIPFQQLRFQQ